MKKKFFFLPLLAALVMAGCSKEDSDNGGGNGSSDTRYLAVSIATAPSIGETRADENRDGNDGSYLQSGGRYEDGLASENEVKKVRFYFFKDGQPMNVESGSTRNYKDFTPATYTNPDGSTGDHSQTVEKSLEAVLIVNTAAAGGQLPTQVLAVVNPPSSMDKQMNLGDLRNELADYTNHENGFVMTNSVYVESGRLKDISDVTPAYFCTSEEEAKANPLRIYVERCVGKVRVQLVDALNPNTPASGDKAGVNPRFALKYKDDQGNEQPLKIGDEQVYVELLGWNVTAARPNASMIKKLSDTWLTANPIGLDNDWNLPQLHRCFWAYYTGTAGNVYTNFNDGSKFPFTKNENYTYCNENAARTTGTEPTKVIIPAYLCKADGTQLTICEYAGVRFVDDYDLASGKELPIMKNNILTRLRNNDNKLWREKEDGSGYREIDASDLSFAPFYSSASTTQTNHFYTKVVLSETAKQEGVHWYKEEPQAGVEPVQWTEAGLNEVLADYNHIKVWKNGMTYYYLTIPHIGTQENTQPQYGVVRNHVYAITVKGIYGLGTPVYDPTQKIIPEKPSPEDVYIAAQVELLSWRLVNKDVELDWGK